MNVFKRLYEHILCNVLKIRLKPRTLQLPITSFCNSRCVTCNIWKLKEKKHIDEERLTYALKDKFFNKVSSVGINGGEPSLHTNFEEVLNAVLTLPSLKDIYIISNGMKDRILLSKLENSVRLCRNRGVKLHLTISLDGVGTVDDMTRGVKGAFNKTMSTIRVISEDINKYCDYFDVGYTISNRNYYDMAAVKVLLEKINVVPYFHIAVPNKRIHTFNDNDFSVLSSLRAQFLTREFFYGEFVYANNLKAKIKNFINYYYLKDIKNCRIASCNYLYRDVTIDENLRVYLCATASETVGTLTSACMSDIIKTKALSKEAKSIEKYCKNCIHYAFAPTFKGMFLFIKEVLAKANLIIDLFCARMHI